MCQQRVGWPATGRRIGSAALVADGLHARTDGPTSPAVLLGAAGSALGRRLADPVAGLLITPAIAPVPGGTVREVGRRPMDAVDPAPADAAAREPVAVNGVGAVRMRRSGHALRAEAEAVVDRTTLTAAAAGRQVVVAAERAHGPRRPPTAGSHRPPRPRSGGGRRSEPLREPGIRPRIGPDQRPAGLTKRQKPPQGARKGSLATSWGGQ
ncbi:hypothetical protein GCM10010195_41430 [Kitasatospora griseola]|nr:hypothetical protein GCM10010195_41430 [Kitasatospora griseola]